MIKDAEISTPYGHFQNGDSVGMHHVIRNITSRGISNQQVTVKNHTTPIPLGPEERYRLEQIKFYQSYDPSIGFNTALVLGVMLVVLLSYVVYRTKIRKHIIAFFHYLKDEFKRHKKEKEGTLGVKDDTIQPMTYSFENEPIPGAADVVGEVSIAVPTDWEQKPPEQEPLQPITPVPHQFVSFDTSGTLPSDHTRILTSHHDEHYKSPEKNTRFSFDRQYSEYSEEDSRQLPVVVMDMKIATADWVRKQQRNFLNPGGFILKVKSDTICPPNNESYPSAPNGAYSQCMHPRQCLADKRHRLSVGARSYFSLDLNKSVPYFEVEGPLRTTDPVHCASKKRIQLRTTKFPSFSSEPRSPLIGKYGKCSSFSSEPKSPHLLVPGEMHRLYPPVLQHGQTTLSLSPPPKRKKSDSQKQEQGNNCVQRQSSLVSEPHSNYSNHSQTSSNAPPPKRTASVHTQSQSYMHITPIIKIQNYDKAQRKQKSVAKKDSNDSACSSSSEDEQIYSVTTDKWQPPPRSPRRGILVRENAITSASCQMCDRAPVNYTKQISLDAGFQLRLPSPKPHPRLSRGSSIQSNCSIPNMETRL